MVRSFLHVSLNGIFLGFAGNDDLQKAIGWLVTWLAGLLRCARRGVARTRRIVAKVRAG